MLRTGIRLRQIGFSSMLLFGLLAMAANGSSQETQPDGGDEPKTQPAAEIVSPHVFADRLNHPWVDSVLASMTPEERIAQLFMVAAYSNKGQAHVDEITHLVEDTKIGGLIFFQGGPVRQARLTNRYQSKAKTPLLISIDGEWGLAMRLDSTIKYPRQMMLGAIQNDSIVYAMGRDIAEQCKRLGVHVNLAPVVDVNNNPKNPVIGSRSFGEDKYNVARKGIAYMKGMQDQHVLTTAKHFPGHGDTDTDSHKALPTITASKDRLYDLELYPFREMIKNGLSGMMVAHLNIPALDSSSNDASTLSKAIVTDLLKEEMGFNGLIYTDALNMKGVSAFYKPGVVDRKALVAGNDVLLFAEDVPTAIGQIQNALTSGEITQEEIDARVRKLLAAKHFVGLDKGGMVEMENLVADLNDSKYETVQRELAKQSVTLLKNEGAMLPLQNLDTLKIASVAIGNGSKKLFQETMDKYADVTHFSFGKAPSALDVSKLRAKLSEFDVCIISIHNTSMRHWKNYGVTKEAMELVTKVNNDLPVVLDIFANPYALKKFYAAESLPAIVVSYQDNKYQQEYSAQMLFGGIPAQGKLPVTASPEFELGLGLATSDSRFEFTVPEAAGMSSVELARIDAIVENGIKEHAYPGCQVLVARKGKVVYRKSYGHHTYEGKRKVKNSDIYDLASITKVASSTLSLMHLTDQGKFSLDKSLCDYLPDLVNGTPYSSMNLRDMLSHQAGLVPWIPFYTKTLIKGQPKYDVYTTAQSERYPHRVAEDLYIHEDYPDSLLAQIVSKPLRKERDYKYSDLGYYFVQQIVEKQTGMGLDAYAENTFYRPMGLRTMGYTPRGEHDLHTIVPTEYDMAFRKQLVHGDVHDPGAAMMGGVGGHAGLFSNATDLGALMQMMMDWGEYGGNSYVQEGTVKDFIRCQYCDQNGNGNRRGAGFDKPVRNSDGGPTCNCISYDSFGHSGFTGTLAWADPNEEIVYVFLSNRVYPNANNKKLITMGIRTDIQQVIYDARNAFKAGQSGYVATPLPSIDRPVVAINPADTLKGPAGK